MPPLQGITVLDFTTLLPGPLAALMLAEAGARVIKIEAPGGEDFRHFPPMSGGYSASFAAMNAGKETLEINLKDPAALDRLRPMIAAADVLIEQFRPGVMARLGLSYEAVRAINPRLIYCSITGYGQSGPRAQEAGHDLNYIARSGMLSQSTGGPAHPVMPPLLAADIGGGSFPAVINILLGLMQRDATGAGSHIDIAMADTPATFAWHAILTRAVTGANPRDGGELFTGGEPRYRCYAASDGRLVAVGAMEDKFWHRFCDAIGLPAELRGWDADTPRAMAFIEAAIAARNSEHWRAVLEPLDACICIVATVEEAMADPQFVGRGLYARRAELPDGSSVPRAFVPVAPQFRSGDDAVKKAPAGL